MAGGGLCVRFSSDLWVRSFAGGWVVVFTHRPPPLPCLFVRIKACNKRLTTPSTGWAHVTQTFFSLFPVSPSPRCRSAQKNGIGGDGQRVGVTTTFFAASEGEEEERGSAVVCVA
jgi:hypothetical protein